MTKKEALALKSGDRVYVKKFMAYFEVDKIELRPKISDDVGDKVVVITLKDGRQVIHKDAQLPEKMHALALTRIKKKNRDCGVALNAGISFDDARTLNPGDLVYVKKRNAFVRIKSISFGVAHDVGEHQSGKCFMELSDGETVSNDDIQFAPKDAVEGSLPF